MIMMVITSCRDDSDEILSYAENDGSAFKEANSSLEGQFRTVWTALNCNYPIWDYEGQQGLDWDETYKHYLPLFKELDEKYNCNNPIPDSILDVLYTEMVNPLHDGHLSVYIQNIHTGNRIESVIIPQLNRKNPFDQIEMIGLLSFSPSLDYYRYSLTEYIKEEEYIYGKFKDGIMYFRLPQFNLGQTFDSKDTDNGARRIYDLWEAWFNGIQTLHKEDSLKGIILDLRNNIGGDFLDYKYVLGALHHGKTDKKGVEYQQIGYVRTKAGIGRLDFSSPLLFGLIVYPDEHVEVTCPIVVLVNRLSASMSEITCISAKLLKNGHVIGTKTYGAYSPIYENAYEITYAGSVGDPALAYGGNKQFFAPFYIEMASAAFLSMDKEVLDGDDGIEPDEFIELDFSAQRYDGKDNQIDAALKYIRNTFKQ